MKSNIDGECVGNVREGKSQERFILLILLSCTFELLRLRVSFSGKL